MKTKFSLLLICLITISNPQVADDMETRTSFSAHDLFDESKEEVKGTLADASHKHRKYAFFNHTPDCEVGIY